MIIAIDPDAFIAALHDIRSEWAMNTLYEKRSEHTFAFDKGNALLKEYVKILEKDPDKEKGANQFLSELIDLHEDQRFCLHTWLSSNFTVLVNRRHCNYPVEPVLIGMGVNTSNGFVAFLAGKNVTDKLGLRHRGLHDPAVQAEFHRECENFHVVTTEDAVLSFPTLSPTVKTVLGHWYEDKIRFPIVKFLGIPDCRQVEPKVVKNIAGQVDFYGQDLNSTPRRFWIGECKLRELRDEDVIEIDPIKNQLIKKIDAVRDYESGLSEDGGVVVMGYIISNAVDMTEKAWELASRHNIHFIHTQLSQNWRQQPKDHWRIEQISEYRPRWNGNELEKELVKECRFE